MNYLTIKPTQLTETLKTQIEAREQEVWGYEVNIKNFERLLEKLPTGPKPKTGDPQLLARYDFREDIKNRLINEQIQQERSQLVLSVLMDQLPEAELEALKNAAKT